MTPVPSLRCAGCGAIVRGDSNDPFCCPNADSGDGRDHVLTPCPPPSGARFESDGGSHPFVRFRELLWVHRFARARGLSDAAWIELVGALDEAVAAVDGRGFQPSPARPSAALSRVLARGGDEVWIQDETRDVAGSHKARHLFGVELLLQVRERTGLDDPGDRSRHTLAIASCGNAALAAAVIARAAGRPLRVFIPPDANRSVVRRLDDLGAEIEVCRRGAGTSGDPCVAAFRAARDRGAIPFCVQGSENGLTIEGCATLAWELAGSFAAAGAAPDCLFIQTGGGALASACIAGLRLAVERGVLPVLPRIHPVQTTGAAPLRRAWERIAARALEGSEDRAPAPFAGGGGLGGRGDASSVACDLGRAESLRIPSHAPAVCDALRHARRHRARYMWPWEAEPRSIAHGILDDETYDWAAVVEGAIASGGWPVTVSEERLAEARALAWIVAGIPADATGAAGLAGLLELRRAGAIGPGERVAILFTGVERGTGIRS